MRVVLLGAPGAGKGTQAVLLAQAKGLAHISTGQIMREAVAAGSGLGVKVKGFLDRGELVPDELVIGLIRERLGKSDCKAGFLLDGFPRTLEQAKSLQALLKEIGLDLTHVLEVDVPEEVILGRINKRASEQGRSDDSAEVLAKRMEVYWAQTAPLASFYDSLGMLRRVNGLGTVEEVQERIQKAL